MRFFIFARKTHGALQSGATFHAACFYVLKELRLYGREGESRIVVDGTGFCEVWGGGRGAQAVRAGVGGLGSWLMVRVLVRFGGGGVWFHSTG